MRGNSLRKALKNLTIVLLFLVCAILLWGVGIEPRLIDRTDYRVSIPALPAEWNGKRIAYISDMQLGMFLSNSGTVRRIIDQLILERPAVVLIGGDYIYHPTEDDSKKEAKEEFEAEDTAEVREIITIVTEIFRPLAESGIPVYSVLGNHDYAMENRDALELTWVAEALEKSLEQIGIPVLQNQIVPLDATAKAPLYLVAIGAHYPNNDHVEKAFADLPQGAPRVVLMHNPQSFVRIPAGAAPLAVAGHTHGGQIRIPFLPTWSWLSLVEKGDVHTDGWIPDFGEPGNRLYVNRGIGFSTVPIRINCLPEVTYFTLSDSKQ